MKGSEDSQKPGSDDALEARIVAWVLGEASPFEAAELEKLCAEDPKLREFERRMRDLDAILAADAKPGMHASWQLPEGKPAVTTLDIGIDDENGKRWIDAKQNVAVGKFGNYIRSVSDSNGIVYFIGCKG